MDSTFKYIIINELEKLPFYKVSHNGISHTVKCPYCNDDSRTHGHFCLKIDVDNNDEPILYNCLKCSAGGILTSDVLNDLGLNTSVDIKQALNKSKKRYARKNKLIDVMIEDIIMPPIFQDYITLDKLKYLNDRLGTSYTADIFANKYRAVFKLSDILISNNISYIDNVSPKMLENIDKNYVGFLSLNKNHIIFRKINDSAFGQRYMKVVLNKSNIDQNSFYTIPSRFDIMYTNDISVHISEGIFDIISIHDNLCKNNTTDLFYAVCGFGYLGVIKNIIRMGLTNDIHLNIYADNDKSDDEIIRALKKDQSILPFIKSITLHRNGYIGEKDFGVPANRIKEVKKNISHFIL